jgi:hypothetical protein
MFNFNFGGIKGTSPTGLTTTCRTREGHGATERTIRDNFRAYRTPEEGAEDYLRLLQRRYGSALESARAGAPGQFVRELKRGGYFTGSEDAYVKSVSGLASTLRANGYDSIGPTHAPIPTAQAPAATRPFSEENHFVGVDAATAVSLLTLGVPDYVARSAMRILGEGSEDDGQCQRC